LSSTSDQIENKRKRTQDKLTAHEAKIFLFTCMDFRLLDDINETMKNKGYDKNYDHFIIAGSSLGLVQEKYPHWGQSAIDHLSIGLTLHHPRKVIFIDHMDCGAYKKFYPDMHTKDDEVRLHHENMQHAHDFIKQRFPDLKFHAYLMELSGDVSSIDVDEHNVAYDPENKDKEKINSLANLEH